MCGRFTLTRPGEVLSESWEALAELSETRAASREESAEPALLEPRFNIAPTQPVAVLVFEEPAVRLRTLEWGLRSPGAPDGRVAGRPLINARAETVTSKPSFRRAFETRRCVVLADGFFEWRKGARRQPYYFRPRDRTSLCFAGLWNPPVVQEHRGSCCLVTTDANAVVAAVHNRMPVVLEPNDYRAWLDPMSGPDRLLSLLRMAPAERVERYPVSMAVNRAIVDRPDLIARVAEPAPEPVNLSLF